MADAERIPRSIYAKAVVAGVLESKPVCRKPTNSDRLVCRTTVRVGGLQLPIVAFDEWAEELSRAMAKSYLEIYGHLRMHKWSTADGTKHKQLEIEVLKLQVEEE